MPKAENGNIIYYKWIVIILAIAALIQLFFFLFGY